jgi:methionyl-tRNA formyltransferase
MRKKIDKTVLLFAKEKPGLNEARVYLERNFKKVFFFQGKVGDPFPVEVHNIEADICVSYLSPWVIPPHLLNSVKTFSINFHPGPPAYPGIGCTNFAIYGAESEFGITVHHMVQKVDTGKIIRVIRFPIHENENVYSLSQRCYEFILKALFEVFEYYVVNNVLPECDETWKRMPFTRKELNALCKIDIDMNEEEIVRRIGATSYPGMPGAYVELHGIKFYAAS